MSLTLPKTCSMGGSKTGLVGTIGVTLLNPDGTVHTARATAGIYEIGGGCYGKQIAFPDNWKGSIKWDTGGGSPVYATEDYDVEGLIDMIEEDTNAIQGKLPDDKIAGSSDATSLESKHGTTSWQTATGFAKPGDVVCGGGGGGGFGERPSIWKSEEKVKLIEDIKNIHKMIDELGALQSAGVENVKKDISDLRNALIKIIKEEIALLVSIKKAIAAQSQTDSSIRLTESVNVLISKWDSIQHSILKSSDLSVLNDKLNDMINVMVKSLSNKDLEKLVLENEH